MYDKITKLSHLNPSNKIENKKAKVLNYQALKISNLLSSKKANFNPCCTKKIKIKLQMLIIIKRTHIEWNEMNISKGSKNQQTKD